MITQEQLAAKTLSFSREIVHELGVIGDAEVAAIHLASHVSAAIGHTVEAALMDDTIEHVKETL